MNKQEIETTIRTLTNNGEKMEAESLAKPDTEQVDPVSLTENEL